MRDGDFSVSRPRRTTSDSLGEVYARVNEMAETLHEQRLGAHGSRTFLLQKVMREMDVAIFAFDDQQRACDW